MHDADLIRIPLPPCMSRAAADTQPLCAIVALDPRDHLRCVDARVDQTADLQGTGQTERAPARHLDKLLLDQPIGRQWPTERRLVERMIVASMASRHCIATTSKVAAGRPTAKPVMGPL
ncbi:hypothetical protein [Salinisphaera sp. LB1]|uniref:hypothetical protein n=1 Tax=Salinisphaera sp. LB1 TaxID=2183911 RepID=UPI0011AB3D34|nr:hypothetical protein [Salinisphaera sp. LB1]